MARCPDTAWHGPVPNMAANGMGTIYGVVMHIMEGTLAGTDGWFHNPAARASSHWGTSKAGQGYQWVDTKDRAWAQANGNSNWLSIENEGHSGDQLTAAQLEIAAKILAWAHNTHGVALQVTNDPNGRGLGWHGMGGAAWGGHYDCPGNGVKAQLQQVVDRAKQIVGGPTPPAPAPVTPGGAMARVPNAVDAVAVPGTPVGQGAFWVVGSDGGLFAFGGAPFHGSLGGKGITNIVAMAPHGSGGYWMVGADGGVFSFGDAPFHGSYPGLPPEARLGTRSFIGMAADGDHYCLYADDGGHYYF